MELSSCVATHRITPPIVPGVFPVVRLKKKLLPYVYHQDLAILGWESSVVSRSCKRSSGIGGAESAALFFCSRVKASLGGDSDFLRSSSSGRSCHGPWTCLGVDSGRLGSRINALGGGGGEGDGVVQARAARGIIQPAKEALHLGVSMGLFLALDTYLKNVFEANAIRFPSALFGMMALFALLNLVSVVNEGAAARVEAFFVPANLFIQRWLPLFYVPSLVVVPLAVKDIPAAAGVKISAILVGGWIASLAVAGFTAVRVRAMVKTQLLPADPIPKPAPFSSKEVWSWAAVMLLSFVMAVKQPTALGPVSTTALPFFLSATVLGYLLGSRLPADAKKVLHPIISCAITANLAAIALGFATHTGYKSTLGGYLTKSSGNPGAGDLLMGFLGSVILSFAFSLFRQRKVVQRHATEIVTAVGMTSIFSLYSTAAAGRLLGLPPFLTCSIVPRCVTVALALPIARLLEGSNISLTAAVVVLTGLVGANFAQTLMNTFGFTDPIARGMATASSSHGLGTAALAAEEPEALPFCAIAYAFTGIFSTLLCTLPPVRSSLLMIAGA
ncbi:unnamed protein product [Sphagnum jensenii]|uniref:Plastidal glycolate/glycerate translocator 1, chloroplastic n=1 Tax=Sphagnum jensenii TaxID=128206 RepID=A0ABP0W5Y7_9BRYO